MKKDKFEPIQVPDVDSLFDPVLIYDSVNKTFQGEIHDSIGDPLFCSDPNESIKKIGKDMQNFANQQIVEWKKFKLVLTTI